MIKPIRIPATERRQRDSNACFGRLPPCEGISHRSRECVVADIDRGYEIVGNSARQRSRSTGPTHIKLDSAHELPGGRRICKKICECDGNSTIAQGEIRLRIHRTIDTQRTGRSCICDRVSGRIANRNQRDRRRRWQRSATLTLCVSPKGLRCFTHTLVRSFIMRLRVVPDRNRAYPTTATRLAETRLDRRAVFRDFGVNRNGGARCSTKRSAACSHHQRQLPL